MEIQREVFYSRKTAVIQAHCEYDPLTQTALIQFAGLASKDEIIDMHRALMVYLETHKLMGLLYNLLEMKGTFTSANSFFVKELQPYLNTHGLACSYIALTSDIFSRFAMNSMLKISAAKFELRVMGNWPDAKKEMERKLNVTLPWSV